MKLKVAFLALAAILLSGCLTSVKNPIKSVFNVPEVTSDSLEIAKLDFNSLSATLNLKVVNTNSISVEFPDINWELSLGEHEFIKDSVVKGKKLSPNSETVIQIPIKLDFKNVYARIPEFRKKNEIGYSISADLDFKLPIFGTSSSHIISKGTIPIYKAPKIKLETISLTSMEPEVVEFEVVASISNDNSFDMTLEKADYSLKINGTQWANGNTRRHVVVEQRSVGVIPINISIKTTDMVSEAYVLVLSEQDVRYEFAGKLALRTGSDFMNAAEVPFSLTGTKKIKL